MVLGLSLSWPVSYTHLDVYKRQPKIYIDGKEGTTGLQIYERLGGRDDLELLLIDEEMCIRDSPAIGR